MKKKLLALQTLVPNQWFCRVYTCASLPDGYDDAAYEILLVLDGLAQRLPQLQLHKVLQLRVDAPPDLTPHNQLISTYRAGSFLFQSTNKRRKPLKSNTSVPPPPAL